MSNRAGMRRAGKVARRTTSKVPRAKPTGDAGLAVTGMGDGTILAEFHMGKGVVTLLWNVEDAMQVGQLIVQAAVAERLTGDGSQQEVETASGLTIARDMPR